MQELINGFLPKGAVYPTGQNSTTITISDFIEAIAKKQLMLDDPSFQRRFKTNIKKSQEILASIFRPADKGSNIIGCLSMFVFDENSQDFKDGLTPHYNCADGLQRGTIINKFISNEIKLPASDGDTNEPITCLGHNISRCTFREIPQECKDYFLNYGMVLLLLRNVEYKNCWKYFKALNNGTKLSSAEHRNAMYSNWCNYARLITDNRAPINFDIEKYKNKKNSIKMFDIIINSKNQPVYRYLPKLKVQELHGAAILTEFRLLFDTQGVGETKDEVLYDYYTFCQDVRDFEIDKQWVAFIKKLDLYIMSKNGHNDIEWSYNHISSFARVYSYLVNNLGFSIKNEQEFLQGFKLLLANMYKITKSRKANKLDNTNFMIADVSKQIDFFLQQVDEFFGVDNEDVYSKFGLFKKDTKRILDSKDKEMMKLDSKGVSADGTAIGTGIFAPQYDHIKEHSKGGETSVENTQILTQSEHREKTHYSD